MHRYAGSVVGLTGLGVAALAVSAFAAGASATPAASSATRATRASRGRVSTSTKRSDHLGRRRNRRRQSGRDVAACAWSSVGGASAEKAKRAKALAAYKRQMAVARRAYFRSHRDAKARATFIKRQKAALKALQQRVAACG